MRSPWMDIPLDDYEAHMVRPEVGQAGLLSALFGEALDRFRPSSVALVGCSGGNGLERVSPGSVRRVVAIDLNPEYVARTRLRFQGRLPGLETFVGDVQTDSFDFEPVDLVFAGLLFEYVDVSRTLTAIGTMLETGGILATVLQLPGEGSPVTRTPYRSLEALGPVMELVPPLEFSRRAERAGFGEIDSAIRQASGGKRFLVRGLRKR